MNIHQFYEISLIGFSIGLSWFCFSLARKVKNLNDLESGLGGAIAVMISEVERLESAVQDARAETTNATSSLAAEIERSKQERAYWAMQQKFTNSHGLDGKSLIRKRQRRKDSVNEA